MNMLMFPGQGSQIVGMGKHLFNEFKYIQDLFYSADEVLQLDLSEIIFEGNASELKQTQIAQPAIMLIGYSVLTVLEKEYNFSLKNISLCAGHSLGEYTALCASKCISFIDCIKLLHKRGLAMSSVDKKDTGMVAILGTDLNIVEKIVFDLHHKTQGIFIANDNCPGQIVVSGYNDVLEKLSEYNDIKKTIKLEVSGPFHSPLISKAIEKFSLELEHIVFMQPKVPILHNIYATLKDDINYNKMPDDDKKTSINIKDVLLSQLVSRVRWRETLLFAEKFGIKNFYEIGCGNVLTGLGKKTLSNCNFFNIYDLDSLKNIAF